MARVRRETMTEQDKIARIYALASKLGVKIAPPEGKPKKEQNEKPIYRFYGNLKRGCGK